MGKTLYFYNDPALTVPLFSLPFGSVTSTYVLADMASFTDSGKTIYYYNGLQNKFSNPTIDGVSMAGKNYSGVYTDGFRTFYLRDNGNNIIQWDSFYHNMQLINRGSGGSPQFSMKLAAVEFTVEGIPFIALGFPNVTQFTACLIVSANVLGAKATNHKGGENTPPGAGADADAGWGSYDYASDEATGSALPSSGAIPVSASGHGHHLYRMTAAALQQLGDHLWGRGSVTDKVAAISDLWQRWQNYRFTPIAGIISCMRLPDALTPISTSADVGVRLAGTHVPIDGTISGCTWIDSAPTKAEQVLDADINPEFGSWLDFEGVSITLMLPFVGRVDVSPSACMGGHIRVDYYCDPLNGNCAAMIWTTDRWGKSCLYQQATGNCAVQVPLTGQSDGMIPMIGSQLSGVVSGAIAAATGNAAGMVGSMVNVAGAAAMERHRLQTAGNYAGSTAYIGSTQAAILITYAHPTKSPHYDHVHGRPSDYGADLGDYSGYTVLHDVDVDIPGATAQECEEIKRLLESGVIF